MLSQLIQYARRNGATQTRDERFYRLVRYPVPGDPVPCHKTYGEVESPAETIETETPVELHDAPF